MQINAIKHDAKVFIYKYNSIIRKYTYIIHNSKYKTL